MKTLDKLETDAALARAAFVLACNDVRQEVTETADLARRTLIIAQDNMYQMSVNIDKIEQTARETSEELRGAIVVISVVALVALMVGVYLLSTTEA